MILPEIASELIKELTPTELKKAAKDFGLSHYYFKQKIQSVETDGKELLRAIECIILSLNKRQNEINKIYQKFLNEYSIKYSNEDI